MSDQPQYNVFLAHNSQDKPQVRTVAQELRQRGTQSVLREAAHVMITKHESLAMQLSGSYNDSPANGDFRFTRVWAEDH